MIILCKTNINVNTLTYNYFIIRSFLFLLDFHYIYKFKLVNCRVPQLENFNNLNINM